MRSRAPTGEDLPRTEFGPIARVGILLGKFLSEPARIAKDRGLAPLDLGSRYTRGRSLSRACIECHGADLSGGDMIGAPDLMVAASYQPDEFRRLIREGVAPGGRKLDFMRSVGPERLRDWSDDDVAALHDYLRARSSHLARLAETGAVQP
jgi:cytochrome c553